jgi:uncharacterized protein YuzE
MLGWDILVKGMSKQGQVITIASWSAGLGGCQWLDDLTKQGIGKDLGGHGYPNRYELPLLVLLDKIVPMPPSGAAPLVIGEAYVSDGSISNYKLHDDVILDIDFNAVVEIEAWDQS